MDMTKNFTEFLDFPNFSLTNQIPRLFQHSLTSINHDNLRISEDWLQTNLIVRWEDELEYDDEANQRWFGVVKPKRTVQFSSVHQQRKHHKTQESIHLRTP